MATPRRRSRSSARPLPWGPIAAAGAVGIGAYLLLKPRPSPGSTAAPLPIGGVREPTPSGTTTPTTAPAAPSTLASRLRSSFQARLVFAVQSVLYSYGRFAGSLDGIEGAATDAAVRAALAPTGLRDVAPISRGTLIAVDTMLAGNTPLLLPVSLPRDVVDTINREMGSFDPAWPMLQIPASQVLPAGLPVSGGGGGGGCVSAGPRWRR